MTAATIDLTESIALTVLRAFLLAILPAGVEVIKAQANRVPEPAGDNFVLMTPLLRGRLATNVTTYSDGFPSGAQTKSTMQETSFTAQLDVHGPAAAENAQVITTLFRDEYAAAQFSDSGYDIAPLYASDPRQMPFVNGEQQIETRWTVDLAMQMNPSVGTAQDFAGVVTVGIHEVDSTYPP